jgi:hypothetical protein
MNCFLLYERISLFGSKLVLSEIEVRSYTVAFREANSTLRITQKTINKTINTWSECDNRPAVNE